MSFGESRSFRLRAVPPNTIPFVQFLTMREKVILTMAIEIQKEN